MRTGTKHAGVVTVLAALHLVTFATASAAAAAPSIAPPTAPAGAGAPASEKSSEAQRRARKLFEAGETHFHAGLFAEALGDYQAGYDAAALPGFLINIAQCQRRLGNLESALTTYRKFIMVAPDSPFVPQVRVLIADLEKLSTDIARDDPMGPASPARDADAERQAGAGAPALSLSPRTNGTSPDDATLLATTPTEPPPRHSSARWWVMGGIALAALAGGTAAIFALRSGDTITAHEGTLGTLRR